MKDANKKDISVSIDDALEKKAFGFDAKETVEEYAKDQDGEITLTKKKVTVKFVPPDVTALKMLMDRTVSVSDMTDEDLEREKQRLLDMLKKSEKTAKKCKIAEKSAKKGKTAKRKPKK